MKKVKEMNAIYFDHSTLYISKRSPFARRVRIAFLEHQIPFTEKVFDVFQPTQDLFSVNPLGRVPALVLPSGQVLIDSHLILFSFYENQKSSLRPHSAVDVLEFYRWQALAVGLAEKVVEYFLETLKDSEKQDPTLKEDLEQISGRILEALEKRLQSGAPYCATASLTQADFDLGIALTYLSFRYSADWKLRFPLSAKYLECLEKRPSFEATLPQ